MSAGQSNYSGNQSLPTSSSNREVDPSNMLMSPPPEETLRATRSRTTPSLRYSATPEPSYSDGLSVESTNRTPSKATKRKRLISSASSSRSMLDATEQDQTKGSLPLASVENTPNPKSRKQAKRTVSFALPSSRDSTPQAPTTPTKSSKRGSKSPSKRALTRSPGESNPLADFSPRSRERRRTRSATPVIPPYEPPPDKFTPPREVFYTPVPKPPKSPRTVNRRKSSAVKKKLVLQIKTEIPEGIDLNAPIPPPSPSDDPLLLRGPNGTPRKRAKSKGQKDGQEPQEQPSDTQTAGGSSSIQEIPPPRSEAVDATPDVTMGITDTTNDELHTPTPSGPFDFSAAGDDDGWTTDSDKESDQVIIVPTKDDPPSSSTQERQRSWGRQISPFPKSRMKSPILEEDEEMPESPLLNAGNQAPPQHETSPVPVSHPTFPSHDDADVFIQGSSSGMIPATRTRVSEPPVASIEGVSLSVTSEKQIKQLTTPEPSFGQRGSNNASASRNVSPSKVPDPKFNFQDLDDLPPSDDEDLYLDHVAPIPTVSTDNHANVPAAEEEDFLQHAVESGATEERHDKNTEAAQDVHSVPLVPQHSPTSVHVSTVELVSVVIPSSEGQRRSHTASPVFEAVTRETRLRPHAPVSPSHADDRSSPSHSSLTSPASPSPSRKAPHLFLRPRSPTLHVIENDSEDDEEDEVSVVRELSQQPDSDDETDRPVTRLASSFAQARLMSSPNPFNPSTPSVRQTRQPTLQPSRVQAAKERLMASMELSSSGKKPAELSLADNVGDEEPGSKDLDLDPGVVKITSDDPLAAARAAAILRLHRYNCLDETTLHKRRHSNPAVDAILRRARKKTTFESGVAKTTPRRRHPLGKVIGDKVFIPGSPAVTLPELLDQEEVSLQLEEAALGHSPLRKISYLDDFQTPSKQVIPSFDSSFRNSSMPVIASRDWTKDDWKLLDSCYTDERLALGDHLGTDTLAPAEDVDLVNVVERFVEVIGGNDVLTKLGPSWSRDDLLKRSRALQRKQRSGNIAPPTPSRASSIVSTDTNFQRYLSPHPTSSVSSDATVFHQETSNQKSSSPSRTVRYDKLIDEALAILNDDDETGRRISRDSRVHHSTQAASGIASPSLATRVKGFFFSYLPRAVKARPEVHPSALQKGLPVPPPEVFNKPRPPISTPAPKPKAKPAHPKELVNLHPAPAPKPSMIPRPKKQHRRLIELNHVSPPESKDKPNGSMIRERRDSGASVKDLVKTFEDISRQEVPERESVSRLSRRRAETWVGADSIAQKPSWRP